MPLRNGLICSVVLGADHEQISFLFPHDPEKMLEEVAAHGTVDIPDLSSSLVRSSSVEQASPATTGAPGTGTDVSSEPERVIGRAPEGKSCA